MRPLTRCETSVLLEVPHSQRVAFVRLSTVKKILIDSRGIKPQTVDAIWVLLKSCGLIEETVGFCRRTPGGDAALQSIDEARNPAGVMDLNLQGAQS